MRFTDCMHVVVNSIVLSFVGQFLFGLPANVIAGYIFGTITTLMIVLIVLRRPRVSRSFKTVLNPHKKTTSPKKDVLV